MNNKKFTPTHHFDIRSYSNLTSTNDEAANIIQNTPTQADKTVIWALEQTKGRGRRNREWVSQKGNLYFSLILSTQCLISMNAQLSYVSAIAMMHTLNEILPPHKTRNRDALQIKWPNDILYEKQKICGILLESIPYDHSQNFIIIGIGLNILSAPHFENYKTSSLSQISQKKYDLKYILDLFCMKFGIWYDSWRVNGFKPICKEWLSLALPYGTKMIIRHDNEEIHGTFKTLSDDGQLVILTEDNREQYISSGDVLFS